MSNESKIFLRRGIAKTQAKEYNVAIDYFTKALQADAENVEAYLERIYAKLALKDYRDADTDIEKGKLLFDNFAEGILAFDKANDAYQRGDFKYAITKYDEALLLLPSLTNIYFLRGSAKKSIEELESAAEDLSKAIELDASNKAAAFFQRGKLKQSQKDFPGAKKDFMEAIELSPNDEEYYYSIGGLCDDEEAIGYYSKAITLNPANADSYIARAVNYMLMSNHEAAHVDLTIYLEKASPDAYRKISDAYYFRGVMNMHLQQINDAISDWTKSIDANPENPSPYFNRGIVYKSMGKEEEAEADFSIARRMGIDC